MKYNFPVAISCLLIAAAWQTSQAQDFRIETDVFVASQKQPSAEYLTVFIGDKIYDFLLTEPQETTILDLARGRFILLDPVRQMKTELLTSDVNDFNAQLREMALPRDTELFQPDLSYSYDKEGDWHVLSSDRLTYRAKGAAPRLEGATERYHKFADWYAQLNAIRPANLPPYGRMELNRVLAERGLIPKEVEREITVTSVVPFKKAKVRSHHAVWWVLNQEDQRRMHRADDQIASYAPVKPDEYFQLNQFAEKR